MLMLLICAACKGIDADAAAGHEKALHLKIARLHQIPQIIEDDVYTVFVKIAVVAEAEQIQLQAFALDHAHIRYIIDVEMSEIGLSCLGAQGCEFRTVETYQVITILMLVDEGLKQRRIIIHRIFYALISE